MKNKIINEIDKRIKKFERFIEIGNELYKKKKYKEKGRGSLLKGKINYEYQINQLKDLKNILNIGDEE